MTPKPVLNNGFVNLVQACADDLTVANAARVSLATRSEVLTMRDEKLIELLMQERHTVPFEHTLFTFHIRVPLFVIPQFLKHRISSISQQSGRYSVLSDEFYEPDYVRHQVGKSMSYHYEAIDQETADDFRQTVKVHNAMSYDMYQEALDAGVAKEQARMLLPPTVMTEFWLTMNAHSLMNFLRLRNDEHAQWETRQVAAAMEEFFAEQMPVTFRAFKRFQWHLIDEGEDLAA